MPHRDKQKKASVRAVRARNSTSSRGGYRQRPTVDSQLHLAFLEQHAADVISPSVLELFLAPPDRMGIFGRHLASHRPKYVYDLRTLPAFDGGGMSRRSLFRVMADLGVHYMDTMALIDNAGGFGQRVVEFCVQHATTHRSDGSVLFMFESVRDVIWTSLLLQKILRHSDSPEWEIRLVGVEDRVPESIAAFVDQAPPRESIQSWMAGEILYLVAPSVAYNVGMNSDGGELDQSVEVPRGSAVKVLEVYGDLSARAELLTGKLKGTIVRISLQASFAKSVR